MAPQTPRLVVPVNLKRQPWEQELSLHNRWHPQIPPVAEVKAGEFFRVEMVDWTGLCFWCKNYWPLNCKNHILISYSSSFSGGTLVWLWYSKYYILGNAKGCLVEYGDWGVNPSWATSSISCEVDFLGSVTSHSYTSKDYFPNQMHKYWILSTIFAIKIHHNFCLLELYWCL